MMTGLMTTGGRGGNAAMHRESVKDAGAVLTTPPSPGGRNAAEGLATVTDASGQIWADNAGELMLLYEVQSGDSISGIAGKMYGNAARWPELRNVAQNRALQGPDPNTGLHPGDVIMVPNMTAPAVAPAQPTPGPAIVTTTGTTPATTTAAIPAGVLTTTGQTTLPPPGVLPAPGVLVAPGGNGQQTAPDEFWTPIKIAVAGVAGVSAIGAIIYFASKPKRRKRRKKR